MSFKDALKTIGGDWNAPPAPAAVPAPAGNGITRIPLANIEPDPDQPRKVFDADKLKELADSIREDELQQPIGLRSNPKKPGHYLIRFGERRFRAVGLLGWEDIPAIISDSGNFTIQALVENIQREDLAPMEKANAIVRAMETEKLNATQLAKKLGKPNSYVTTYTTLVKMPPTFQKCITEGTVNDVNTLYEAYRLADTYPSEVEKLLVAASTDKPVNRDAVRKLAATLKGEDARPKGGKAKVTPESGNEGDSNSGAGSSKPAQPATVPASTLPRIFVADDDAELGHLNLARPAADGQAFVIRADNLETMEQLSSLRIVRIEQPA